MSDGYDATPLDGKRIDVAARIGWLLRVNREAAGLSQRDMSERLGRLGLDKCSASVLNRLEKSGLRRRRLIEGYESVLQLSAGSLVSAVQMLGEFFPYAPPEDDLAPIPRELATVDRVVQPLLDALPVKPRGITGGQWMTFARTTRVTGLVLPTSIARPLLSELIAQLAMAVDTAYRTRHVAMQELLRSGYAGLVEELVMEYVDRPGCAVMHDAIGLVAEVPSQRLFDWLLPMLGEADLNRANAARLGIETLSTAQWATPEHLQQVAEVAVRVLREPDVEPERREGLARMLVQLPTEQRDWVECRVGTLEPRRRPVSWSRSRRLNNHLAFAHRLARVSCDAIGLEEQPMAERLVFEMLYDPRVTRSFTSMMLLGATPMAPTLVRACIDLGIKQAPDPATRAGCIHALVGLPADWDVAELVELIPKVDLTAQGRLLVSAGHRGVMLPEETLRKLTADPRSQRDALYCLGFLGHPLLAELSLSPDPELSRAAAWWRDQGPAVVD